MIVSALFEVQQKSQLFIFADREEALYFFNDLQAIYGYESSSIAYFPASFRRPFEPEEVDNANVIQRSELLNHLIENTEPTLIVSYTEAVTEKVVNKRTLIANTLHIKKGDPLDLEFLSELLIGYEFEKADFVYEPGQFAIRGGIVDVYTYAASTPYRIELLGSEVENIRKFDPDNQLSLEFIDKISLVPNLEKKVHLEEKVPIFNFLPSETIFFFSDFSHILEKVDLLHERIKNVFKEHTSSDIQIATSPSENYLAKDQMLSYIEEKQKVELGNRTFFEVEESFMFESKAQPSFNKDFNLLIDDIAGHQAQGYDCFISSDIQKQLLRIETIFTELRPKVRFTSVFANLKEGFIDPQNKILLYTDHQIFERLHLYKEKKRHSKSKALTIKELKSLQPGDYVTHVDYGIGRFAGLESVEVNGHKQETIRLIYKDNDLLYINVHSLHKIAKYAGKEGELPSMSKLGSGDWDAKKSKVKKQVKDIAKELIALYSKRREVHGFAFSPDSYLQIELESSFMYEDTPDQASASQKVKDDMEKTCPMDRLVCGDVGFGKTEVAIRAAFKAVNDSKQVAVLVPTTILAMQHFRTFSERLVNMPVKVDYLNRFKTAKDTTRSLKEIAEGKVDILIGTHKVLNKNIKFKDLGLLIIDEEQKFGVKAKDRIKELKLNVDVLTLTATPIPRTLHFSLMGARDLSVIATPPANRQPVTTHVDIFKEDLLRDAITHELSRGGQVFFVHNRVSDIASIANIIYRLVPEARIGIAHGQMEGEKLEKAMVQFIENDINVLISTNIIESGLDIPNANTIIINQAHMFGLSDLHQMRGRVGRSNKKAYCYLLTPPISGLTRDARKRLQVLEEFTDLGDGFKVAMRDLDIRGAGNLLGSEQSGFINDLGYDMYHKILDEAVGELKENEFKNLFSEELSAQTFHVKDVHIETDLQILIPEDYIQNTSERLSFYNAIDDLKSEENLNQVIKEMNDRFGKIPNEIFELLKIVKIRWLAQDIGFEKVVLKNNKLNAYFVSSKNTEFFQSEKFGKVLDFIKQNPKDGTLKPIKDKLMFSMGKVNNSLDDIIHSFDKIRSYIN